MSGGPSLGDAPIVGEFSAPCPVLLLDSWLDLGDVGEARVVDNFSSARPELIFSETMANRRVLTR